MRWNHSAIYDPRRDHVVVLGGVTYGSVRNEVWLLPLSRAPYWIQVFPTGQAGPGLSRAAAVHDPLRDRMLVIGGYGSDREAHAEVWSLSFEGAPEWTLVEPSGSPPPPRFGHTAVYDVAGDRVIVFGGLARSGYGWGVFNDVWALSLGERPRWSQLTPAGIAPGPRWRHSAIYDAEHGRMVVFGGSPPRPLSMPLGDLWSLSLEGETVWTPLTATGTSPGPMAGHGAVYDAKRQRMLVLGTWTTPGCTTGRILTLSLDGSPAWGEIMPCCGWPAGSGGSRAVLDSERDRLLLVGGSGGVAAALTFGDAPAWQVLVPPPVQPSPRQGHVAAYDPVGDRMIVHGGIARGGSSGGRFFADTWALSLAGCPVWQELIIPDLPPARAYHSPVYDPLHQRLLVYGGFVDREGPDDQVWALALGRALSWSRIATSGALPPPMEDHAAVYDPVRDRMLVVGGYPSRAFSDVWALSLGDAPVWSLLSSSGAGPPVLWGHTAIYDPTGDRVLVFGGYDGRFAHNEVWALSLGDSPAWSLLGAAGPAPSPCLGHSAILDPLRRRMVVFGGVRLEPFTQNLSETWALELGPSPTWRKLEGLGLPPGGRHSHTAVYDPARDRMVVFHGAYSDPAAFGPSEVPDAWFLAWGSPSRSVAIDIRPGNWHNFANERSRGLLPVAILSVSGFDPSQVDPATVRIAGAPVARRGRGWAAAASADLDHDGIRDLLVNVESESLSLSPSERIATLTARTYDGQWVCGWDSLTLRERHRPRAAPLERASDQRPLLALHGTMPNPAVLPLTIAFTLASSERTTLELFDLSGRRVLRRNVGEMGTGTHVVQIGESGALPSGLYLMRLEQGGRMVTRRVCVLQ